jgi:hypothetical protein
MSTVPEGDQVVTRGLLERTLDLAGRAIGKAIKDALSPLASRIATLEMRTGALALLAGRGADGEKLIEAERFIARVAALEGVEQRVEALERRHDKGDWADGETYRSGDVVVHHGTAWKCRAAATRKRPGIGVGWIKSRTPR